MRIYGFEPVINHASKILILGSMPSVKSLEDEQYYAFPRNQFWRIIFDSLESTYIKDYPKRLQFLHNNKIALWDVIKSCQREGSLDSKIQKPLVNDFEWLFSTYPNIKYIVFNGNKASQLFRRHVHKCWIHNKKLIKLPSTSPTHTILYTVKLNEWRILYKIINMP